MSEETTFADLIRRVRAGDQDAAAELVHRYEPHIRRAARIQFRDPGLRRHLDSVDICQSVLASFFVRAASGQFDLSTPEHLLKLLSTMARNKLASAARKPAVVRREKDFVDPAQAEEREAIDPGSSPSHQAQKNDLLLEVSKRLSSEERWLQEQRQRGREWADIARERDVSPEALRKQLARALDRVAHELDLDELCYE